MTEGTRAVTNTYLLTAKEMANGRANNLGPYAITVSGRFGPEGVLPDVHARHQLG